MNKRQQKQKKAAENFYAECDRRGYKVLGEYNTARNKVQLLCKEGHLWYCSPASLMHRKRTCSICSGNSSERAEEKWNALISGVKFTSLTEYKGTHNKVLVRCNSCEKEFWVYPNKLYSGQRGCPRCANVDRESAAEKFYKKLFENEIIPLDEYVDRYKPVRVKHVTCGSTYKIEPRRYMYGDNLYGNYRGARCRRCARYVNELLKQHENGKVTSHELLEIVKKNGWETRMEDLENELRNRDYRNAY
ncbi:hypothetical protein POF51_26360 [Brevibacillus sp. AG]|uniref:hypothetical protein n=1 Tax=Brevibacillus sp. AG TaxID=3020891 RepID=UPI002330DDBB|nr:hypothetical protein [Brevibacillus sp. AG]MDC0764247.1 hypothetical protein [Brevibacillus sp. AG]